MTGFSAPIHTLLSVEGRVLTGRGTLFQIQERQFRQKTQEVSLIGDAWDYQAKVGKASYGFSLAGFIRDDQSSLVKLLTAAELAKEPLSVVFARYGRLPGAHVDIFPEMIVSGGDVDLPSEGLQKVNNVRFDMAQGTPPLLDAVLITNRKALSDTTGPYEETRYDFGAAHTDPWQLAVHVDDIQWEGATAVEVEIHTNSSATPNPDGSGWTRVTASGAHVITNAAGVVRGATFETSTEDLSRWVAVNLVWSGGSGPTADIIAALHRA